MIIPKKIHFTCKNKNNIDNPVWIQCLEKYRKMYTDYEIIIYDNNDIYNIVEKNFPEYLGKIKQITIGAILADIFRYLILYLEGGIYSDLDCEPIKHLNELLNENYIYYHGDSNRDNNFYIYKNKNIIDSRWDFKHNVCCNSVILNKKTNPAVLKCLGHTLNIQNVSTILSYEFHKD
jgi:mannosyltransferase OCH1-like enzyme